MWHYQRNEAYETKHRIDAYRLTPEGRCPDCATPIPGRFERFDARAQFGRRRIPVAIGVR